MGNKRDDPLEALSVIHHHLGWRGGGLLPNDSPLSKLGMMQLQHSPSQHPTGGGVAGSVSVRGPAFCTRSDTTLVSHRVAEDFRHGGCGVWRSS